MQSKEISLKHVLVAVTHRKTQSFLLQMFSHLFSNENAVLLEWVMRDLPFEMCASRQKDGKRWPSIHIFTPQTYDVSVLPLQGLDANHGIERVEPFSILISKRTATCTEAERHHCMPCASYSILFYTFTDLLNIIKQTLAAQGYDEWSFNRKQELVF